MVFETSRADRGQSGDVHRAGKRPSPTVTLAVLVGVVAALGLVAGVVAAETTVIGFEGHDPGAGLTTQYDEAGVTFVPQGRASAGALVERCGPDSGNCAFARTGENAVVTPQDGDFVRHPLVISFAEPQDRVRLYVQEAVDFDDLHTAELVARDASGAIVARSTVEITPGSGWHEIAASAPSTGIVEVTLTLGTIEDQDDPHNNLVVDDLAFQRNEAPTATFEHDPDEPIVDDRVTFDASRSADPDGEIVGYSWDFDGDGRPDRNTTGPVASHGYRDGGTYEVSLVTVDDAGAVGRTQSSIHVVEPPMATFDVSGDPVAGESMRFDATESFDPDGEIVGYSWDFGGDGRPDLNTSDPVASHTYGETGIHEVSLTVLDDDGVKDRSRSSIRIGEPQGTGSDLLTILALGGMGLAGAWLIHRGASRWRRDGDDDGPNQPPVPTISHTPEEPTVGRPVKFDGSPSHDPDPDDRIGSYRWTVEGASGAGPRFVHEFEEPGEHEVTLEVTDTRGSARTRTETVAVEEGEGELALEALHPDAPGDDHENLDQEYFVFGNAGDGTLDLGGWSIHDTAEEEDRVEAGEHSCSFPDGLVLESGETVAVHVGEEPAGGAASIEPDEDHHLFWGRDWAVWNNDEDIVVVEDDAGNPVFGVRYRQTDEGEFAQQKLDPSALANWFPDGRDG